MDVSTMDIDILRTAASMENSAVAGYAAALALPVVSGGSAIPFIASFLGRTRAQHAAHALAFNAAATAAGGRSTNGPSAAYLRAVDAEPPALTGLAGLTGVVARAISFEDLAAQTYVKNATLVSTPTLRSLFVSVAGVDAQHKAVLLAIQSLMAGGVTDLITLGPDVTRLPAAVGSVTAVYPTLSALAAP